MDKSIPISDSKEKAPLIEFEYPTVINECFINALIPFRIVITGPNTVVVNEGGETLT